MFKDIVFMNGVTEDFQHEIENFIAEWESQSAVITVQSSGTTGQPKTFQFSKEQAIQSAKKTGEFFQFKQGDSLLLNLSPKYIAGKLMIIRALVYKLKLIVAPLQTNPLLLEESLLHKIKLGAFVPSQITQILSDKKSLENYNQLENVLIGGAAISNELETKIGLLSPKAFASFGMTETLTHFALRRLDGLSNHFTTLNQVEIGVNERSCLKVKSIGINNETVQTNDVVEIIDSTKFSWLGRIDNVINSGGIKIFPEQLEEKLGAKLAPLKFYITSRKNNQLGEEAILIIESEPWSLEAKQQMLEDIKLILPKYHNPKDILFESKLDVTETGKIKRKKF